jgi:hypothetical protein
MYNPRMHRYARVAMTASVGLLALAAATPARAAAPWIYRGLTQGRGDIALDFGLGYGHASSSVDGFGLNLELKAGVAHNFDLGFRMGFRLDEGGQATRADAYGRPFDTETYGTLYDRVANPEIRARWSVARSHAAELGLELRFYLPIEDGGSRFGFMFGLPIALRAGPVRFDTGIYVPVVFYNPTFTAVSIPLHIWIQAAHNFWLGPLLGLRVINWGGSYNQYPLGFGLGWQLNRGVDLKTWFLFPDMNQNAAARTYGLGVALQIRFE